MSWNQQSKYFLIGCLAVTLFVSNDAIAQSGRRQKTAPPVVTTIPVPSSAGRQIIQSEVAVSSILVGGELAHNFAYFQSSYLNAALQECLNRLKTPLRPAMKVGKMSFNEAKDRAKREPDAYILWLSFVIRDDGLGGIVLSYIDYSVLMPRTAMSLTSGRVIPGDQGVLTRGEILTIPSRTKRAPALSQMKTGAREVADRLKRGGWL